MIRAILACCAATPALAAPSVTDALAACATYIEAGDVGALAAFAPMPPQNDRSPWTASIGDGRLRFSPIAFRGPPIWTCVVDWPADQHVDVPLALARAGFAPIPDQPGDTAHHYVRCRGDGGEDGVYWVEDEEPNYVFLASRPEARDAQCMELPNVS